MQKILPESCYCFREVIKRILLLTSMTMFVPGQNSSNLVTDYSVNHEVRRIFGVRLTTKLDVF